MIERIRLVALLAALLPLPANAAAQEPPASQHGTLSQTIDRTIVSVTYDRPVARGRQLFGEEGIVLSDALWTPGANRATIIEFSGDVRVEGRPVPAGRYSIWMIPRDGPWTMILNRRWDTHHAIYPGVEDDVLRVELTPVRAEHMEVLAFYFPVVGPYDAQLRLHWGETVVPIRIEVPRRPGAPR